MIDAISSVIDLVNRAGVLFWPFASLMFVQTLVLVAVLFLAELALRQRVRAAVRYWLWALVLLKLLLPATLRTPASAAYWLLREPVPTATASTMPPAERRAMRSAPSTSSADPFEFPEVWPPESNSKPEAAGPPVAVHQRPVPQSPPRQVLTPSQPAPVAISARREFARLAGTGWLFLAWCGGCAVLGIIVLRRAAKVWQLARQAAQAPRQLEIPLEVACSLLDLSPARVRLRISDEVGCPAICGFWRPTILVPRRLVGQLGEDQFQLVFAHELLHWKRWDLQLNLLQTLLQIAYFYNPAVWIANAMLRRLREEAVDDAVLIAFATQQEAYSNTLLDVAAQSLRPVELSLRLVGILESRKALAERIGRMARNPFPKTARLGPWGLAAVVLIGVALLPMAGSPRAVAQRPAEKPVDQAPAKLSAAVNEPETKPAPDPPLRGRITDEEGKPVTDATIRLINVSNRVERETATSRDGGYHFDRVWPPGEHEIEIYSDRCLGLISSVQSSQRRIVLDPKKPLVQDFTLRIACEVRVQALDEGGHPVQGVHVTKVGPINPYQKQTDREGWITIGGLMPGEHHFACGSQGYIITRLPVKFDSPKTILERKLVLKRGVTVQGRVLCSDGKPAAGWYVVALPSWWDFYSSPMGERIKEDGTFVLPHIGPGAYDVTIHIPRDGGSLGSSTLLRNAELASQHGPLVLHVDAPSPGSMVEIQGRFRFIGGRPKQTVWINATSARGVFATGRWPGPGGKRGDSFSMGPFASGKYHLTFDSPEIETKEIDVDTATVKDLTVDIHVSGPIVLRGTVSLPGAKGPEPAREFLVRVVRLRHQRGRQPRERWDRVFDLHGQFSEQVPGPGIYAVEATADGFLTVRSEPIDTGHLPEKGIQITLLKGATVAGRVIDEEGRPIDGAIVMSLAKAGGELPVNAADTPNEIGVRTVAGRFQFEGLRPGSDTFQVAHPNYALATLRNVEVRLQGQEPLRIVMKRGGSVCGHVQDEQGRLMAGVSLRFERSPFTYAGQRFSTKFATAITDANGYYEVHHLPDELIHIVRDGGDKTFGVSHEAVLPVNGKTRTVDFGAGSTVSGQLFINGAALASTNLQLSDASSWDFEARTTTDSKGTFVFAGIPPGKLRLSYAAKTRGYWNDWVPVRELDVNTVAHNFGRIDHRMGTVTVQVAGTPRDDARVYLFYRFPSLFQVWVAAEARNPRANGSPFLFEHMGPGKYDIAISRDNQPGLIRQMLVLSPDNLDPTITIEWRKGTASIRGTIDRSVRDMIGNGQIELANRDVRWSAPVRFDLDGQYELGGIPAGEYALTLLGWRSGAPIPVTLKQIRLADGEAKKLDIARDAIPVSELSKQVVSVSVFTPQGIPLPGCEVRLTGPEGELIPTRLQGAHVSFAAPPGSYRLSASFLGAETLTQTVEVKRPLKDGPQTIQDPVVNLTLGPIQ
jgi:beta-lactamase regulating signal transducer with metallopeptidase domain/protocatechuate 3,4-dioxygenase beta subunit